MNRLIKYNLLLVAIMLSTSPAHSMEKNSIEINNLDTQIKYAIEHNKNHKLLVKEIFDQIIDYWTKPGDATYVPKTEMHLLYNKKFAPKPEEIAYQQINVLLALHTTCQYLNTLVPFDTIITFCKNLEESVKNKILMPILHNPFKYSLDNNRICSALIRGGANANFEYEGLPLFFYAKSIEMVERIIMRGCNIHTFTKDQINVLSHVTAKEYPSDLMKLYLRLKVVPHQRVLHTLVYALKDHCTDEYLRKEYLNKCALLLDATPQRIKGNLNWELKTPLDVLNEQIIILSTHNDNVPEFQKIAIDTFLIQVIDLFKYHSCHRSSEIQDNMLRAQEDMGQFIRESNHQLTFMDEVIFAMNDGLVYETEDMHEDNKPLFELNNKIVVKEPEKPSNSILILAVLANDIKTVKELLKHGTNPEEVSIDGRTALDIAMENGNDDIAALLIESCDNQLGG